MYKSLESCVLLNGVFCILKMRTAEMTKTEEACQYWWDLNYASSHQKNLYEKLLLADGQKHVI